MKLENYKGFKYRFVSGWGKDAKVVRNLTKAEIKERQKVEWLSLPDLLKKALE